MSNQSVVTRIWDLFMWYGRRGPAVLVWVALAVLHGCRQGMFESHGLPATVKAVRRYAEGCKNFDDLVRQAPVGLNQVNIPGQRGRTTAMLHLFFIVVGCISVYGAAGLFASVLGVLSSYTAVGRPCVFGLQYSLCRGGLSEVG